MQEHVHRVNDVIFIKNKLDSKTNIRPIGEQLNEDDLVFTAGYRINTAMIGMLVTTGFEDVPVYKSPDIGIVTTGSELISTGQNLKKGKIY